LTAKYTSLAGINKEVSIPVTVLEGLADAQARPLDATFALDELTKTWWSNRASGLPSPQVPGVISLQKNTGTSIPSFTNNSVLLCTIDVPRAGMVLVMPDEYLLDSDVSIWAEIYTRDLYVNDGFTYHEDGSNGLTNYYSDWAEALVVYVPAPMRLYVVVSLYGVTSAPLNLRWSYAVASDYLTDSSLSAAEKAALQQAVVDAQAEKATLQQVVQAAQAAQAAAEAALALAQSNLTTASSSSAQALADAVAAQAASDAAALADALNRLSAATAAEAQAAAALAAANTALQSSNMALASKTSDLTTANANLVAKTTELATANAQLALVDSRIDAAVAAQAELDRLALEQAVADKNTATGALTTITAINALKVADMDEYARQVSLTGTALRSLTIIGDGATPAEVDLYKSRVALELSARNLALSDMQAALGFAGEGSVHGTLYSHNVGVSRVVRLYSQASGELVSTVFSAANGAFIFNGLSTGDYYITAHDFGQSVDTVICKNVVV
jgi:hypothetical protein